MSATKSPRWVPSRYRITSTEIRELAKIQTLIEERGESLIAVAKTDPMSLSEWEATSSKWNEAKAGFDTFLHRISTIGVKARVETTR